ncbi:MAG: AAA family ATPase [Tannerella sp.]|jgi:hypothetical protein|nr:AAA family ATPase [Tannerella sp.]
MKKLSIGIQSFSDLRSSDYLYVDQTETVYHPVTAGKVFSLSRPRRFGKCYCNQAPGRILLPGIAFPGTETGCIMEVIERGT